MVKPNVFCSDQERNVEDFHIERNDHTINSTDKIKYIKVTIDHFLSEKFILECSVQRVKPTVYYYIFSCEKTV